MNRLLAAVAVALALPLVACAADSTSEQSDGLKEWSTKVPSSEVQATVDELQSRPKESGCYPRTCSVSDPDADGNVTVVYLSICATCPCTSTSIYDVP